MTTRKSILSSNFFTRAQADSLRRLFELEETVYTVATLPTGAAGVRALVSDATVTTFASVVAGGGANTVPVYHDGTDWRIG